MGFVGFKSHEAAQQAVKHFNKTYILQLVIGACWWETTHEHSCALHFWIFVVSVQTRSFYGKNFFFFFHSAAGGLLGGRCGLSTGVVSHQHAPMTN
jgi:hypothetical protein